MTKFMHGERVYYDCLDGYSRTKWHSLNKGTFYVDCLNGTWTKLKLKCIPSSGAFDCDRPASNNANVYLDSSSTQFPSGARVRYTCAVGYAHVGGSRYRTCYPGKGTWSPLKIRCEPKSCGSAGEIENGEYDYTGVEFGGMATAACNEGYQLVGRATRTCLSEGWDGPVDCDPPETNAEMTSIWRASYTYRQVIQYRCPQGTLVGQANLWCAENGTWSAPPPVCRASSGACERPASNNANVYFDSSSTQFPSGATVRYTCAVGYAHVGGSRYRTCYPGKGTWSPLAIRCEPKSCGSAGEIENGEYVYTGVEFGGMVTAACNEGYQLVGRATRTCLSEGWDGRTATCQ
ncbi:hypothetical protein NHX12_017024, partial [Muraenolepis orangiensis]